MRQRCGGVCNCMCLCEHAASSLSSPPHSLFAVQVRLLESHTRQGVQQVRQARDLAEEAQRSIADAGAWVGDRVVWRVAAVGKASCRCCGGRTEEPCESAEFCHSPASCHMSLSLLPCCVCPAEARAARAEGLLRKVDERKAAAEVERRRATEAAARLEQQVRLPGVLPISC